MVALCTSHGVSQSASEGGSSVVAGLLVAEVVQVSDVALLQAQQAGQALHVFVSGGKTSPSSQTGARIHLEKTQRNASDEHCGTAVSYCLSTSPVMQVRFITCPYV